MYEKYFQDHAAAAMAARGIPVYAWKGETDEEYMWYEHIMPFPPPILGDTKAQISMTGVLSRQSTGLRTVSRST